MKTQREMETEYKFRQDGRNGDRQLGPYVMDVTPWEKKDLLRSRYPGNNLIGVTVGTTSIMLEHPYRLITEQGFENSGWRVGVGASAMDRDLVAVTELERRQSDWVDVKRGREYVKHRPETLLVVKKIAGGANGADPFRGLESLHIKPQVLDTLDEAVDTAVGMLKDDGNITATIAGIRAYGGSYPQFDYTLLDLTETIPTTLVDLLHVVPARDEPRHRRNAKGELALVLESEPAEEKLNTFVLLDSRGKKETDVALMAGLLGLTSNGDGESEFDQASIHGMFLDADGGYAVARPCRVPVVVKRVGKQWLGIKRENVVEYESPVDAVVSAIRDLVWPTRDDFHLIALQGIFTEEERRQLRRQCRVLGNLHLHLNIMRPLLSDDGRFADFLVCDFSAPHFVPLELVGLFGEELQERYRHGVTWDQLREMVVEVPEKQVAVQIRDEVKRIRAARRR